jgi:hypothetical protein
MVRREQQVGRVGPGTAYVLGDRFTVDAPLAERLAALWQESGLFADHWTASPNDIAFIREKLFELVG